MSLDRRPKRRYHVAEPAQQTSAGGAGRAAGQDLEATGREIGVGPGGDHRHDGERIGRRGWVLALESLDIARIQDELGCSGLEGAEQARKQVGVSLRPRCRRGAGAATVEALEEGGGSGLIPIEADAHVRIECLEERHGATLEPLAEPLDEGPHLVLRLGRDPLLEQRASQDLVDDLVPKRRLRAFLRHVHLEGPVHGHGCRQRVEE